MTENTIEIPPTTVIEHWVAWYGEYDQLERVKLFRAWMEQIKQTAYDHGYRMALIDHMTGEQCQTLIAHHVTPYWQTTKQSLNITQNELSAQNVGRKENETAKNVYRIIGQAKAGQGQPPYDGSTG